MAYNTFNLRGNSRVVRKFDNISTDFPAGNIGVVVPAGSEGIAIVVDTVVGTNFTMQVTFDLESAVLAGTCKWYPYTAGNTSIGSSNYIILSIAPSGIRLIGPTSGAAILC